jgi:hypothetical protein
MTLLLSERMKPKDSVDIAKVDIIQKIAAFVTLQGPIRRIERWVDCKLKNYSFELKDGVLISGKGCRVNQRIAVSDIRAWQEIWIGGGLPFICIELVNGTTLDWHDKYGTLFNLLHAVAEEKERPFLYI